MHSLERIAEAHIKLQAAYPSSLVLLGGSYSIQEATEDSDVDLYLLHPWWSIFKYQKIKTQLLNFKKEFPFVNIMLVPTWRGVPFSLYYIHGVDTRGTVHHWMKNKTVLRNAAKLALFNYIRYLALPDNKVRNLQKSFKQLATAELVHAGIDSQASLFSWQYVESEKQHLRPELQMLLSPLRTLVASSAPEKAALAELVKVQLLDWSRWMLASSTFSWSQYLAYNFLMFIRGRALLLHGDPDIIVIGKMTHGLSASLDPQLLYDDARTIVFPVIII